MVKQVNSTTVVTNEIWSSKLSKSNNSSGCSLVIENNCNLAIFAKDNPVAVWSTAPHRSQLNDDEFPSLAESSNHQPLMSYGTCPVVQLPTPVTGCGPVPAITNGHVSSMNNGSFRESRQVQCDFGYNPEPAQSTIVCQHNGCWTQVFCYKRCIKQLWMGGT